MTARSGPVKMRRSRTPMKASTSFSVAPRCFLLHDWSHETHKSYSPPIIRCVLWYKIQVSFSSFCAAASPSKLPLCLRHVSTFYTWFFWSCLPPTSLRFKWKWELCLWWFSCALTYSGLALSFDVHLCNFFTPSVLPYITDPILPFPHPPLLFMGSLCQHVAMPRPITHWVTPTWRIYTRSKSQTCRCQSR